MVQLEQSPTSLPHMETKGIYDGKFRDRSASLRAAGKLTATGDTAHYCLQTPNRPTSPDVVRRFRASLRPDYGKPSIFYGKACDPHLKWAAEMTHGLTVQPSIMAGHLLNPSPNTRFRQGLLDRKDQHYASHKNPLGKSHDQRPGLPKGMNTTTTTFGIPTEKDGYAGDLINPNKSRVQVEQEGEEGRDLYRKTHFDYLLGEQKNHNYASPSYQRTSKFGIPTPHDNAGGLVKKTMVWLQDAEADKATPIVSKRVDLFRERTQPQLGKVHDPIKDTMKVGPNHTFGILVKPDEYGASDLLHMRGAGQYLRGQDRMRGVVAAMRQLLKKANYQNFDDLTSAFQFYDTDRTGKISMSNLEDVCRRFNLPVDQELLHQLMTYCDVDGDGLISYKEFANFLNWRDKLPASLHPQSAPAGLSGLDDNTGRLAKQIDHPYSQWRTSSSMIDAVVNGTSTKNYRTYGVPTVRSDLAPPVLKRVSERKNFGDESYAYGLMNPSIYSNKGVYEKDFLMPRSREELFHIMSNSGVKMTRATFDDVYKTAATLSSQGTVSVEAFRNVLDEGNAIHLKQQGIVY